MTATFFHHGDEVGMTICDSIVLPLQGHRYACLAEILCSQSIVTAHCVSRIRMKPHVALRQSENEKRWCLAMVVVKLGSTRDLEVKARKTRLQGASCCSLPDHFI